MSLKIPQSLPAIDILKGENIFVIDSLRADTQDIRPLKIALLNLMPIKVATETDLIRLLSNSPLQIEIEFIKIKSHTPKNTPIEHMKAFYIDFEEIRKQRYDGLIVTGAPLEQFAYEEVTYWPEVTEIFDWAKHNVTSRLFICWGAFAALYHYYGIPKRPLDDKLFGIYPHTVNDRFHPLFRGFDDEFYVPHSRHITLSPDDIARVPSLSILSESEQAGVYIVMGENGREFFVTGHSEYAPDTLAHEYERDLSRGLPIHLPEHYFRNDDPTQPPVVRWRAHANLLFTNWLNYFVYQETPYDLRDLK